MLSLGNSSDDFAALEAREGRISEAAKARLASLADDSLTWKPRRDPELGPRPPVAVDSLFQAGPALCFKIWG